MDRLPWDIQTKSEWASIRQHAWTAAVESVEKLPAEASYREMTAAAEQAVEPWIVGYKHVQACKRIAESVYIFEATVQEGEAAKQGVLEALIKLPGDTTSYELEKAKETALIPYKAAIGQRKEAARLESEKQARRRAAESKAETHLAHIERYVRREYVFDDGEADLRREVDRLRPMIREALVDALLKNPVLTDSEIRASIERLVDED